MTVDWYENREEALDAEALAIFAEQPKYNVLHRNQALRLKKLRPTSVPRPERPRTGAAKKAKPTPASGPRWEDPRYLAYLQSSEYAEDVRHDFERMREKEQRRLAGAWTECERHESMAGQAINAAIERGIDLDSPGFYEFCAMWMHEA